MAEKKISELDDATLPLAGTEQIPVVQDSVTVKTTAQNVADLKLTPTPANVSNNAGGNATLDVDVVFRAGISILEITSGTTSTKTLPTATAMAAKAAAAFPVNPAIDSSYVGKCLFRVRNKGSGDLTLAANTGWDVSAATLVIATNKARDYVVFVYDNGGEDYAAELYDAGLMDV